MNILIPDSWLREFLQTKASPAQLKEYLSLCGPSIERINTVNGEVVYDIEITTNRPDSMSVSGVAREAAAILPRFGIKAKLLQDPYATDTAAFIRKYKRAGTKKLKIFTDPRLNPRWTSIVLEHVTVGPSPKWLQQKLEKTGIRSLNIVVDITNYLMRCYGQPAHAFDYDRIASKNGIPTMKLRESRKHEKITTLDGKTHILPGGDIVIEDESGRLIDLCGIMGAENSSITEKTTTVILFLQTYDPVRIRRTSMKLAHRTEAAGLFEKGTDTELVLPAFIRGVEMATTLAGAQVASSVYDIHPKAYKPSSVSVTRQKLSAYMGVDLKDKEIQTILSPLGFIPTLNKTTVTAKIPSFRRDVTRDVDIIEEIARLYGYHNLKTRLPDTEPPVVQPDPILNWEEIIKTKLRDWGYTETYTYSMISEELMKTFGLDTGAAYKITNPLSTEWVYMRPLLLPSMLKTVEENLHHRSTFNLFELSMEYHFRKAELPHERPTLLVCWTGEQFAHAKGLAQALFDSMGIPFPDEPEASTYPYLQPHHSYSLGRYGSFGEIHQQLLTEMHINKPLTVLHLYLDEMAAHAHPQRRYIPIPKYPAVREDFSFIVPPGFRVGTLIKTFTSIDPTIRRVLLIDSYQNIRTIRIEYLDTTKTLTTENIKTLRAKVLNAATEIGLELKTQ